MKKLSALVIVLLLALSLSAQVKLSGGVKIGGSAKITTQASGETNFVNDTFTETSDTELSLHTPELGSAWVDHTDGAYADPSSVLGASDRLAPVLTTAGSAYYNDVTPPSADYCVEAVIFVASIQSANTSIALRMNTTANTMYVFRLNNGTSWDVRRIVAGVQTTLPAATSDTTNLPGVGESRTMKLCITGGATPTLSAYVNGTQLTSLGGLDADPITAAGKPGVRFVGTQTTVAGFHFESFRAFTP